MYLFRRHAFSFGDEWWKYNGSAYVQDAESSWSNGAYPDPNMNEEWWGIVDIYRNPRQAYYTYSIYLFLNKEWK